MPERHIRFIGHAPIPAGHRVEVTWYQREETKMGFLGGDKVSVDEIDSPRIVDLDTSISYGTFAHYSDAGTLTTGTVNLQRHSLQGDLTVREKITGKVKACSIADVRFQGSSREHAQYETELVIEVG